MIMSVLGNGPVRRSSIERRRESGISLGTYLAPTAFLWEKFENDFDQNSDL